MISTLTVNAVIEISKTLGVSPADLAAIIDFETAGTWEPSIRNAKSGAVGLLQFLPSTLLDLGYNPDTFTSEFSTIDSQLKGPVSKYLKLFAPFPSFQSLAMAVFYPSFRNVSENTPFPESVQKQNPGIGTVKDYIDLVLARKSKLASLFGGIKTAAGFLPAIYPGDLAASDLFLIGLVAVVVILLVYVLL